MKKLISFILIIVFALSFMAISVNAQCSLSVTSSKKEVYVGNTVTISFTFSASAAVESADITVQFDNSKFQYVSTSGGLGNLMPNQQGKTVMLSDFGSGSTSKTYKITMSFKALAVGNGTFSVISSDIGDANFESLGAPTGSVTVSVKEENKSSNANLKWLTVPAGCTLVPKFSKNVTNYTCTVPYSITKFPMDWETEDKDATDSVTPLQTLKVGENTRTVTVTAPDGTKKSYTVKVIREEQKETPTPKVTATPTATPAPTATVAPTTVIAVIDGKQYNVISPITLPLPDGFIKTTETYASQQIEAASIGIVSIVQLNDGATDSFYVYDNVEMNFTPYKTVKSNENLLTVLDKKPNLSAELTEQRVIIGENEYLCWTSDVFDEGYYILNVVNSKGENYPALYCADDSSVQKLSLKLLQYSPAETPSPTPDSEPLATETPFVLPTSTTNVLYEPTADTNIFEGFFENFDLRHLAIIICAILLLAIIVIIIILIVSSCKEKKSQHDWGFEEEENNGYNFVVEEVDSNDESDDDFE